jgi:hypothetical protein
MPKKLAELRFTDDGPCLILNAGDRQLRYRVRDIVQERLFVAEPSEKRALQAWIRAVEGKPPLPERKPIPASRRIPGRTAKP